MAVGAETGRGRELGPDPRLNGQGVPLTGRQYGLLAVIAVLIGGALVLALVGIAYGFPAGTPAAPGARIVLSGSGRARVAVVRDGAAVQRETVDLPWTAAIDRASGTVALQAVPIGSGAALTCTVYDGSGTAVQQVNGTGAGAAVECTGGPR